MKHPLYIIVAADKNFGIGKDNKLPWHFKNELQYFKKVTTSTDHPDNINMVVMGRKTWESIPAKFRPLPGRKNVVLSKNHHYEVSDGAELCHSLQEALQTADDNIEKIFIIGGANLFEQALNHPDLQGIYLTQIDHQYDCDTFFSRIPGRFAHKEILNTSHEEDIRLEYSLYTQ